MSIATLTWFIVGVFLVYIVATEPLFYSWVVLQSKSFSLWLERQKYKILYNPDSPWIRFQVNRNANKLAKEIIKENKTR